MSDQSHEPATPVEQPVVEQPPARHTTPRQDAEHAVSTAVEMVRRGATGAVLEECAYVFWAWGFCLFATHGRAMLTIPGQRSEFRGVRVGV